MSETDSSTYAPPPHRFEAGTPPIAECIGFGAAIDFVTDIGMQSIHDHEKAMIEYGHSRLADVEGINFIGTAEGKSGVISLPSIVRIRTIFQPDRSGWGCNQGWSSLRPAIDEIF